MDNWYELLVDLIVIAVFIGGIAQFRTPKRARLGTAITAVAFGAALALVVYRNTVGQLWVVGAAFVVGGIAGLVVSERITMTRIPALIALQNGAGGGASLLVSLVELGRVSLPTDAIGAGFALAGVLVGGVALSGSVIAAAKLDNHLRIRAAAPGAYDRAVALALLGFAAAAALALTVTGFERPVAFAATALAPLALGAVLALRVGGADMPVLISLLNAFSGLAAAFLGVATSNEMLIAAGAMVGSSGTILTLVMARAMNRSVRAILTGGGPKPATPPATPDAAGEAHAPATEPGPELAPKQPPSATAALRQAKGALAGATSIIIVPGYGMALAQAQHEVASLARKLSQAGKLVRFAVHPVAGRMPGHMHVLLAEADVDYDDLYEMDAINDDFASTDVAIVVGASDVVNPAAITVPDTPISGMPILRAHEASTVIVCNLDDRPGYSGVPNPLYTDPKSILLFGDAKETVASLIGEHAR
ncbi:MAG: NAD(P)(+) transhydrogenase (Re/Si-specific) subunit beta [Coriobacteriia bacterium]|nr:NAD(P)(+) transhydrogenase (Re/Si-specific) subunit beta [Coriobacteriia bacterium]